MNIVQKLAVIALIATLHNQPIQAMSEAMKQQLAGEREEIARQTLQQAPSIIIAKQLGIRPLIIIFDPKKVESVGSSNLAMVSALRAALSENIAPVLVNFWTWCLFINEQKEYSLNKQWKAYRSTDNTMLLFVPTAKYKDAFAKLDTHSTQSKISDGELELGMKVKSLVEVPDPISIGRAPSIEGKPAPTSDDLKQYLKEMLVTRSDLNKGYDDYLNYWDICLNGHGSSLYKYSQNIIAGMQVASFGSLLDWLNNGINTRTLFYSTCYSGGNLKEPYEYEAIKKDLNYTVIAANSLDLITFSKHYFEHYFKYLNDHLSKKSEKSDNLYLRIAIHSLMATEYLQYPAIRFPHTQKFILLNQGYDLFQLNDDLIMRMINQGKNEIRIKGYSAILIETRYIPIPVIIEGQDMPMLIPKEINKTDYFFKEINAPDTALIFVWKPMVSTMKYRTPDAGNILIGKLIVRTNPQDTPLTLSDVVINQRLFLLHQPNEKKAFNFSDRTWIENFNLIFDFTDTKESIKKASSLPPSMLKEEPEPIFELPKKK